MSATDTVTVSQIIDRLYEVVDSTLVESGIEGIEERDASRLLTLAVKLYASRSETTGLFSAAPDGAIITATEVAVTTQGLLEAADLDLFELSLWRQWGWVNQKHTEEESKI